MIYLHYNAALHKMMLGDAIIEDAATLQELPLRWKNTNSKATRKEKEAEFDWLVFRVGQMHMYEWADQYIEEEMHQESRLYIRKRDYERLIKQ